MEQAYENNDYIEQPEDREASDTARRLGGVAAGEGEIAVATASQAPETSDELVDAGKRGPKMQVRDERSAWDVLQREPGTGFLMIPDPLFPDKTGWINLDEDEPEGPEVESGR
jgi:hypothetical protein